MKCGIGIDAAFYRGYLIDDRNLTPHLVALATLVALWSLPGRLLRASSEAERRGRSAMVLSRRPAPGALTPRQVQPNFGGA
jgi:hypothetical protein